MLKRIESLLTKQNKLKFKTDLHSHLFSEIDDGCKSLDESVIIVKKLKKIGYTKLIITPHIMSHRYPNTKEIIKQRLFELRSMLKVKNINIKIEAAAEYYCDEHFLSLIQKNELLSFGNRYILFEMSYTKRPKYLDKVINGLKKQGYKPVLAHPERYQFLKEVRDYRSLKGMGILFQVNINSLGGYYGKDAQKNSLMLAQKSMIDFIGSDIHHQKHLDHLEKNLTCNNLEIVFRNNKILNDKI